MPNPLANRIVRMWEKNREDLTAVVGGRMPQFVRRRKVEHPGPEVPVFCFHKVEPVRFEAQLRFLRDHGYTSLRADDLARRAEQPPPGAHREVALTFDDAQGSFWAIAYPLLRRYGFDGILFVVAGLVPDDDERRPCLDDGPSDRVLLRDAEQPLCTWNELREMHASGVVDVQSHSLTHARVPVGPRLLELLHPGFDAYDFGNVDIPVHPLDDLNRPERRLRLGSPVYENAPRLAGRPRYLADPELTMRLEHHVRDHGGESFFRRPDWREELTALHRRWSGDSDARFESEESMGMWIERELSESKEVLESRIPGLEVRHFCYPWFTGCDLADHTALRCGYDSLHYGMVGSGPLPSTPARPARIRRLSEDYLYCLPGGNGWWGQVFAERFSKRSAKT